RPPEQPYHRLRGRGAGRVTAPRQPRRVVHAVQPSEGEGRAGPGGIAPVGPPPLPPPQRSLARPQQTALEQGGEGNARARAGRTTQVTNEPTHLPPARRGSVPCRSSCDRTPRRHAPAGTSRSSASPRFAC